MSPTQITIIVLLFSLFATSSLMWKRWLDQKNKEKELDHQLDISRLEKEKIEVVAKAMQCFSEGNVPLSLNSNQEPKKHSVCRSNS